VARFDIPKILRPLVLRDYAPEMGEAVIQVWVNLPGKVIEQHDRLNDEIDLLRPKIADEKATDESRKEAASRLVAVGNKMIAWHGEIWSQGPEGTRWTEEEIDELISTTRETDPMLWPWLMRRTNELIQEHRRRLKKG
jgi:hypothetical protein